MSNNAIKIRSAFCAFLLFAGFMGLGFRLAFLHLGDHARPNRRIERKIIAGRGNIYDCRGIDNILALNLAVKDICVDPSTIIANDDVKKVASALSQSLGIDESEIVDKIMARPDKRFAYVERFVHEDRIENLQALEQDGIFTRGVTVRYYPHGDFMCHVLGFVNYKGDGCLGVEQEFDSYLRGCPGLLESKVDARRHELYTKRGTHIPALEGAEITLTLDQNVQYVVEKALDSIIEEYRPAGAWAIVQKIRTGEILALANRPSFNLNNFRFVDESSRLNRAISVNYEPGSTMKALTVAAALNEGVVSPSTVIDCENGLWSYHDRKLTDGGHSYGSMTVADVIKKSSNIGTAKIALLLGRKKQYAYLRGFGVGSASGIELPGEERGILRPLGQWSAICPTRIAFGQAYAVTALQVLNVFCTIANDGYRMKPYIIKHIARSDGTLIYKSGPEVINRPISSETAQKMVRILSRVTEAGGTGRRAGIPGYTVAGKTGTAQKVKDGTYSEWVGSFVGFLPAENPSIAIIVVVDEPQGVHAGGVVAAPAFRNIAEQTVRYLDIQPARWADVASR